jgi:glycosyltransferase involved in cell wall biosynthesis
MKILMISPEYPPFTIGGGGIVYKSLSNQLKNKGHSINVVAGNHTNKQFAGEVATVMDENVPVNFVPLFPLNLKNANLKTYTPPTMGGFLFVIKQLVQSKNAMIHLHGFCHPLIDLSAFACMAMGKKYVITCHGIPKIPTKTGKLPKIVFQIYLSLIERMIVQKASALTTVSCSLKNECARKQLINKKTLVIPNGSNLSLKQTNSSSIKIIEKKYSFNNKPLIFAIGRLSENKGFQYLIEAMQHVVMSVPDAVALIAGSGSYKEPLQQLIVSKKLQNNVKLLGLISEEEKAALYKRADVVAFPSINEPFGLVLLEASTMHKPIVGFDLESTREILSDNSSLLVPVGDSQKLGQALLEVLTNPILKSRLESDSKKVKTQSWEKITNQYVTVYNSVHGKPSLPFG